MRDICIYAQVHQPFRLRRYRFFDIGTGQAYFDDQRNRELLRRVADKCYLPTNGLLGELIRQSEGEFRFALSLSGTVLEQMSDTAPDVLESFQRVVGTGGVELLSETSYHSLASLGQPAEFREQVLLHRRTIARHFHQRPRVFRNTELIYFDELAPTIEGLGYTGMMVEGADQVLGWRSANHVYAAASAPGLRLLPRNHRLSDDVGFRFSNRDWARWPLTAETYADWLAASPGDSIHLFLDYETFGEHQWADTGIFEFLRHLPDACRRRGLRFVHPSTLAERAPVGTLSFPRPTSWADEDRGVTAWLGNPLQEAARDRLFQVGAAVAAAGDAHLLSVWRRLTTSDHLYYICTKWSNDGDVHKYFSPYDTPYDAFITFMNVLQDLEQTARAMGGRAVRASPPETRKPVVPDRHSRLVRA
ncbi:MAG TPA: glycoside hydrolase family 57 protein [Gemmatimonadaceae bacterium]|nr:glycoside hydrolase family 57 protein [Gemmatimonadaceae bacterium]